jgi:RNA polymerase sigma-70 factor (ECF subfamily)
LTSWWPKNLISSNSQRRSIFVYRCRSTAL